jgi:hypothetical protein
MPFGLTNAPAVFQHMMNDTFREYLDHFVVIYLDDILIYSVDEKEHDKHVRLVLEKLREKGLFAKLEKCEFDQSQVEFLDYIITAKGIEMDPKKIDTITSWMPPTTCREVQRFLGFANFYRQFIKDFSRLATPLYKLTQKDRDFIWTKEAQNAFETLKLAFTSAPTLVHANMSNPFTVETDVSDFALGAVLSQEQADGQLHPVAFYSRKLLPAEANYDTHDKELLAIVVIFKEWRHFLEGAQHQIVVFSDHKNLQHFMTTRALNWRQARWSLALSGFDFIITY